MLSTEEKERTNAWFVRISHEISAAWAISRKDMVTYYIKPNIIVSGILFPVFMFLAFAIGKNAPPGSLIPGLIAITLLFSASSIEPVSIPIERRVKTFDRLLSAPISLHSLVFGESVSGFLYSMGIVCLPLVIGIVMFSTSIEHVLALIIAMALTAFCFATLGTLFAAYPTENVGEVMSMLNTGPPASHLYFRCLYPNFTNSADWPDHRTLFAIDVWERYDILCIYRNLALFSSVGYCGTFDLYFDLPVCGTPAL